MNPAQSWRKHTYDRTKRLFTNESSRLSKFVPKMATVSNEHTHHRTTASDVSLGLQRAAVGRLLNRLTYPLGGSLCLNAKYVFFSWFPMLKSLTQKLICINLAPAQGQWALRRRRSSSGSQPALMMTIARWTPAGPGSRYRLSLSSEQIRTHPI